MTELDFLNLARSATQSEMGWFAQVITINFAMVVAIYYFLNQAKLGLRVFAFIAYMIGMLVHLGEMLIEGNIKLAAIGALKALPAGTMSMPAKVYVGVNESWLAVATSVVFNSAFWILSIGIFYLLFFWKKSAHVPAAKDI